MNRVTNVNLSSHTDSRGILTEIFRQDFTCHPPPVQWNLVQSKENVLRGVHVHVSHFDYLVIISGRIQVGLRDLRGGTAAARQGELVELTAEHRSMLMIPPGYAHGFYFPEPTTYVYGLSEYWNPEHDEFGCRWDDPALGIPWPAGITPIVSERDERATSLAQMMSTLQYDGAPI